MKYNTYNSSCRAWQMDRHFSVSNIDGIFDGKSGDYIMNVDGVVVGMRKEMFELLFKKEGD